MFGWIYKYTNILDQKSYIGQTVNLKHRKYTHSISKRNDEFHSALRKFGIDNFNFEILEYVEASSKQKLKNILNELEVKYIEKFNTKYPNGYNMTRGGEGAHIIHLSETHKKKISMALMGHKLSPEHKLKLHQKRSLETCKKIGESKKGKTPWNKGIATSKEVIEKQVKSRKWFYDNGGPNKGRPMSQEQKIKLSIAHTGKKLSEAAKQKVAKYNREHPEKYDVLRNKPLKEEHRKRISEALKGVANTKGKIWVNDGKKSTLINPDKLNSYLNKGYKRGRILNK